METSTGGRRIVVGVDGSPHARAALEWAVAEAHHDGDAIDAVLVYDTGLAWIDVGSDAEAMIVARSAELAKEALHDALHQVTFPTDRPTKLLPVAIAGEPAFALVELAEHADLLVVGTRGRGAFTGLFLGSVSQRCAEWSRCPVVVVPSSPPERHEGPRRIVVGVDGSANSCTALTWALTEAERVGGAVEIVSAFERGLAWVVTDEVTTQKIVASAERHADEVLQGVLGDALASTDARPPVTTKVVPGDAVSALLQAADHADLLVVGTRGRGGLTGLLLGSVSQRCAQRSPCPVVVVPTPKVARPEGASS
jgi:nucleotide-binding universal stress UspA family protein